MNMKEAALYVTNPFVKIAMITMSTVVNLAMTIRSWKSYIKSKPIIYQKSLI